MEKGKREEAVRLRDKATEMLKNSSSLVVEALPSSKEPKSSYFLSDSLAKMEDEDPIGPQNLSCVIHEEIVKIRGGERRVYSSLVSIPTFTIGLASTEGEHSLQASLPEHSVDPKGKSPRRLFKMPELGARVFIGEGGGLDTIACLLPDFPDLFDPSYLDFENTVLKSLYKDDRRGGLQRWFRAQSKMDLSKHIQCSQAILSGTELLVGHVTTVGNLGGKSLKISTSMGNLGGKSSRIYASIASRVQKKKKRPVSSFDYKEFASEQTRTMRPLPDILEQPRDLVPGVTTCRGIHWRSVKDHHLRRSPTGSYLKKPKFISPSNPRDFRYDPFKDDPNVLQLTRFDDFAILSNREFNNYLDPQEAVDIVRKHASKTVDVIAAQLVESAIKSTRRFSRSVISVQKNARKTIEVTSAAQLVTKRYSKPLITAVVIFLNHKEILQSELKKKTENTIKKYKANLLGILESKGILQPTILREDNKIGKLKEISSSKVEGIPSSKEEGIPSSKEEGIPSLEEEEITLLEEEEITLFEEEEIPSSNEEDIPLSKEEEIPSLEEEEITLSKEEEITFLEEEEIPSLEEEEITLSKEEEITFLEEEEKIFAPKMEDEKKSWMEEDHKLGMKPRATSSNSTSAKVEDDLRASCPIALIEDDDCKSEDSKVSCHITKWIIYGDSTTKTLLCQFNDDKEQYEFYFEDEESMAAIIGLGVLHSKVVLECGSPHVTVVEVPKEDWMVVWANSNDIPPSIPKGCVLKEERFPNILHHIANIINIDNIVSKANGGGGDNGKDKALDNVDDCKDKGKSKVDNYDNRRNTSHPNGSSNGTPDDNDKKDKKEKDGNKDKIGLNQADGKPSNVGKEVQAIVVLYFLAGGVLEEKGRKQKLGEVSDEGNGKKKENQEICKEDGKEKKKELGEEEGEEKKKEGEGQKRVKKKKNFKALWHALKRRENSNVDENKQKSTTTKEDEDEDVDVDVDENLQKQLAKQIHSRMVFTFTIKYEIGGPWKTIQATIDPITFLMPPDNEDNYLQNKRFGWFHEKLQVAFGVVNIHAAKLLSESCEVLHLSEAKEVELQGNLEGHARKTANAFKGEMGVRYGVKASGAYGRTNELEAKTSKEVQNSLETSKTLTKGGFSFKECTDLNSQQLKFSYFPPSSFNEKDFEAKDKAKCLKMYEDPICQLQRVSCKGTWRPRISKNLEAYKLEASRDIGMTQIYNVDLKDEEETRHGGVQKVGNNLPMYFIQTLEKVVFLNQAMSHLTLSTAGGYHLEEEECLSRIFVTQAHSDAEPIWVGNDPLVDVNQ